MGCFLECFRSCRTTTVIDFVPPKDEAPNFEQPILGLGDLHLSILEYLTPKEVLITLRVCKDWRILGGDIRLWNLFNRRLFPENDSTTLNGFDLFKNNYIHTRDQYTETLVRYMNQGDGVNAEEFLDAIRIRPRLFVRSSGSSWTVIHHALDKGMPVSFVIKLLDCKPDSLNILAIHPNNRMRGTPLVLAFGKYNEDYVDLLLSHGAQVDSNFIKWTRYLQCDSINNATTFQRLMVKAMSHFSDPSISKAQLPEYISLVENQFDISLPKKRPALPNIPLAEG